MKKRFFKILLFLFILVFLALCVKKHRGIVNTFFKLTGIEAPYEWTAYAKPKYGSYQQAIKVSADLDEEILISSNDAQAASIVTDIPVTTSPVTETLTIDSQIQEELNSGMYTFQEPLLLLNPYKVSPLTALFLFTTDNPCQVQITVKGKTSDTDLTFQSDFGVVHRIPVIGLYPNTNNTVLLTLLDTNGKILEEQTHFIQTEKLPEKLENAVTAVTLSDSSAFSLTMVSGMSTPLPFAYDAQGDIRWYLTKETAINGLFALSNGRLMLQDDTAFVLATEKPQAVLMDEMDYLGRTYRQYYVPNGFHHEVKEKEPDGNLLVLSSSLEGHFEDVILELDRTTGEIVNQLNLEDLFGRTYVNQMDWAHINTVSYCASDDSILISARNLHSVMKIDWSTHELKWILCDPKFWEDTDFESYVLKPEGDFVYHFHQHTAYLSDTDFDENSDTIELTLFDNHQDKYRSVSYFDNKDHSYSIVYSINEETHTVRQLKKFETVYSRITSNTIYDSDSNHIFSMCGTVPDSGMEQISAMTYEMDYETGEIINQYAFYDTFYRAVEMKICYTDLSAAFSTDTDYIKGSLRPAIKTKKSASATDMTLTERIQFHITGNILYVTSKAHSTAQIIFKGQQNTYVYDNTSILQFDKDYLDYISPIPIPLSNLEADTYEIFVVYQDEYYTTGQTFTIL